MKSITVFSRDMSHLDDEGAALWPMRYACLCEAAAKANLLTRPPVLILNKTTVVPTNHEAVTELSNEVFAEALLEAWKSEGGFELDLEGYKRTFKFSSCRTKDITFNHGETSFVNGESSTYPMDVLNVTLYKDSRLNDFLKTFVSLLPFSGKNMTVKIEASVDYSPRLDLTSIKEAAAEFQATQVEEL